MMTERMAARVQASHERPKRPAWIAFATTVTLLTSLCALSSIGHRVNRAKASAQEPQSWMRRPRGSAGPLPENVQCIDIHHATDQCAFLEAYCLDEDTGIIPYLSLYYCQSATLRPLTFTLIAVWAGLLFMTIGIAASDFFSVNLKSIANLFNMSENLAGVTFLAFGNGSSDLFSTWAAMSHHSGSLAIGELIGAAGFITAIIPAAMIYIKPFKIGSRTFLRDVSFFAVAIAFSMTFLANGHLELWESVVMILFYIVYVCFVMAHHWRITRKRARRDRELAARTHYSASESHDPGMLEQYRDEADADHNPDDGPQIFVSISSSDFHDLEQSNNAPDLETGDDHEFEEEEEEEERDRVLSEISSNMRVTRSASGRKRTSTGPIRPSLVGALEFQSVLSSLTSQQTIPTIPLGPRRRHSHSPTRHRLAASKHHATLSDTNMLAARDMDSGRISEEAFISLEPAASRNIIESVTNDLHNTSKRRQRAVSDGDARDTVSAYKFPRHQTGNSTSHSPLASAQNPSEQTGVMNGQEPMSLQVPQIISTSDSIQREDHVGYSSNFSADAPEPNLLAPPRSDGTSFLPSPSPSSPLRVTGSPLEMSPEIMPHSYRRQSVSGRTITAEPSELHLTAATSEDTYSLPDMLSESESARFTRRPFWWPRTLLPSPATIIWTLFPSLKIWSKISIFGKLVAMLSVPSVLILTVTLPVVEFDRTTVNEKTHSSHVSAGQDNSSLQRSYSDLARPLQESATTMNLPVEQRQTNLTHSGSAVGRREIPSCTVELTEESCWNRWLLMLQIFLAPLFVIAISWLGDEDATNMQYVWIIVASLLGSAAVAGLILISTTIDKPPFWHRYLSFAGFMVSVFWISTIAEEVVGVLKAVGVIFNISDAILGLTIFAVGNSLGDLVADITVARLGYPVMALSACFGGPLMNILIGIGTSGVWNAWKGEKKYHRKHPDRAPKWKPYNVEVDVTLMVSAVALLITLLGYIIIVPLNKWKLDRKIAIGLTVIWTMATITNIVIEVTGMGGKLNYHQDMLF